MVVYTMFRILIVEDDKKTREALLDILEDAGYEPLVAGNGVDGLGILERRHIDLILLDISMPKMNGLEFLTRLRAGGHTQPVLVVSARAETADRVLGLRAGADDYMAKPADTEELLLRIDALLRRCQANTERTLTIGSSQLIYDTFTVERDGKSILLPKKQFLILYKLLSNPNKTYTRRQLMDEIWDLDAESNEHTVVVHVNRLREILKDNPDFEIVTIRGLGYKGAHLN